MGGKSPAPAPVPPSTGSSQSTPAPSRAPSSSSSDTRGQRQYKPSEFMFGTMLGEGSFAKVYYARDKETGGEYAMKVMEKAHVKKENKVDLVMMERRVMAIAVHPNIVKLLFSFQDSSRLYIAMELCKGRELLGTIRHFVEQNRAVGVVDVACSVELTRLYLTQIISALGYLHGTLQIVHRDLKPENILVDATGTLKLTDFGTAKDETKPYDPKLGFVGTAEYVSPEILRDQEPHASADYWALGCIAFQLLVGRPPLRGGNEFLTFEAITAYTSDTSSLAFPAAVGPHAKDMILKLLDPDPETRLGGGLPGSPNSRDALLAHPFFQGPVLDKPPYIPQFQTPPDSVLADGVYDDWDIRIDDADALFK